MIPTAQASPLYASEAFMVASHPESNGTELIRFGSSNPDGKISSVIFVGIDAALFLTGFSDALTKLTDEEVESQYLNQYGPLMQSRYLQ
jgi:hypothetical protein